ncbi:MAG: phosphoethanolamine transferase [Ginsengibacter sp.]
MSNRFKNINYKEFYSREFLFKMAFLFFLIIVPNIFFYIFLHEKRITTVLINNLFLISLAILLLKQSHLKIIGYLLLFVFVLNNGVEIFSISYYKSTFNVGMAMSFLSSNAREGFEMASGYWLAIVLLLIYFVLICFSANSVKKYFPAKSLVVFTLIFAIFPAYLVGVEIAKNRSNKLYKETGESDLYYYVNQTPLNSFGPLLEANHYLEIVKKSSEEDYEYPPFTLDSSNHIQNVVIVLGESARRDALSLYGNPNKTSPLIDKRISNLLVYNNAVSPGEFTNLAICLLLSKQNPGPDFSIGKNNDNIIALANATKLWQTYWVSNQEQTGLYVNLFANIDLKAKHKYWTTPGSYDEALFPFIDKILKDKSKKRLIFIHLMGSHAEPKMRYPKSFDIFHNDKEEFKNEYNNSIVYTDFVLDNIIKKMEGSSSVVLYLSDHGQSIEDRAYRHSLTKKGFDVPFFIWYSDLVANENKKVGNNNEYISTSNLYNILENFMGIKGLVPKKPNDSLKLMDGSMRPMLYRDLEPGL